MDALDGRRVVQVAVPTGDGRSEVATGYAVAKDRILTCAHALLGQRRASVRFVDVNRDAWLEANVTWPKPEQNLDVDAVLLEVERSRVAELMPDEVGEPWARARPGERDEWSSLGLPRAGTTPSEDGAVEWKLTPFGGKLYRYEDKGVLTLDVSPPPNDPDDWGGASGSPVFLRLGGLVAIVRSWPEAYDGKRLKAVSTRYLMTLDGFVEALGRDDAAQELVRLELLVEEQLQRDESGQVCRSLSRHLAVDSWSAERIAHCLVHEASAEDVLDAANQVHDELMGDPEHPAVRPNPRAAQLLERVVFMLLH